MEILEVLERAANAERGAAEVYDRLATRFRADPAIEGLWSTLAEEERGHASKLLAWRTLLAREPSERRPVESGFGATLHELELTLDRARQRTDVVSSLDEAFEIALDLESSELDAVYTELLHASPIAREPDLEALRDRELGAHHRHLLSAIRARSKDEDVLLRAAILGAEETLTGAGPRGAHPRRS